MSDWAAMIKGVQPALAGLDMNMPGFVAYVIRTLTAWYKLGQDKDSLEVNFSQLTQATFLDGVKVNEHVKYVDCLPINFTLLSIRGAIDFILPSIPGGPLRTAPALSMTGTSRSDAKGLDGQSTASGRLVYTMANNRDDFI